MTKNITVEKYDDSQQKEWDDLIDKSNNGTIFHKIKFLEYHQSNPFNFHHLVIRESGTIVALLPGGINKGVYHSPMGASFGSLVTKDISYDRIDAIVLALVEYCHKSLRVREVRLTPPPLVYLRNLTMSIEYSLIFNGFVLTDPLYSSVIDLQQTRGISNLKESGRRAVRKAMKLGIEVFIDQDYDAFYPILLKNKKKFDQLPAHTLEELYNLQQLFPGMFRLFIARLNGQPIGGAWAITCNEVSAMVFYIAMDYDFQEYRPINIILYKIILWGLDHGFKYLDMGVNQDTASDNPMDVNRKLISFKDSMNAKCFFRNNYVKILP